MTFLGSVLPHDNVVGAAAVAVASGAPVIDRADDVPALGATRYRPAFGLAPGGRNLRTWASVFGAGVAAGVAVVLIAIIACFKLITQYAITAAGNLAIIGTTIVVCIISIVTGLYADVRHAITTASDGAII